MKSSLAVAVAVLAFGSTGFVGGQQVNLRPGMYEVTSEVSMGRGMPPISNKNTDCVTAEDTKDFMKAVLREMGEQAAQCKISDVKSSPGQLTFTLSCKMGSEQMTSQNEMTFNGDSFATVVTTKMKEGLMTAKQSGKWVGDCK